MPISEVIEIEYPEWFEPAFDTQKRYIDIWGGRGRGGSHTGTNYFLDLITHPDYFRGYFVRQSFNDIRISLFQDFKDRIENNETIDVNDFRIDETKMVIRYVPTGNMIISRGVTKNSGRTAKMKSLAGATHILIEEADEVGEDDFDQIDDSVRKVGVQLQIIRIFNPPHKQHWIWRDYILTESVIEGYFKASPRDDRNVLSLFSTFRSNTMNMNDSTLTKYANYKLTRPEYYYTVICGLISEGQKGRIYSKWTAISNDEFNAIDARSIVVIDFGENTGSISELKFVKMNLYIRELYYGGASSKELGKKLCELKIATETIIADSADPTKIAKLRNGWQRTELLDEEVTKYPQMMKGWNIYPVVKTPIVNGIGQVKDYTVFLTEDSANAWDEYREYKWALDKNKNPTDDPEDKNNHCFAAGTMVACIDGNKPIEIINDSDYVLTRNGYKRVLSSGCTGVKQTYQYKISCSVNKYYLNCTENHKINTLQSWKQISNLKKGNYLLSNISTAKATNCIQAKGTRQGAQERCIKSFGNFIMASLRRVITFTTSTTIPLITTLATLLCYWVASITLCMLKSGQVIIKRKYKPTLIELGHLQSIGIVPLKELNNIENKLSMLDLATLIYLKKHALYVASYINLKHIVKRFAATTVKANGVEIMDLTMSKRHVLYAKQNMLPTNMQNLKLAVESVDTVYLVKSKFQNVYDLTVEDTHEYFANGLLVSNCLDGVRYGVISKGRLF